ncbi:MAG: SURF1 family protein [Micrococcaceae bacterium]
MKKYSFLFSSQWLKYFLITALFAVCCYFLGQWQYGRHLERMEQINTVNTNYNQTPVPFETIKQDFNSLPENKTWTHFKVKGHYISQDTRIARNRTVDSHTGFEVLVPFKADDGTIFIVDRGWIPLGEKKDGYPDNVPSAPSGEITLIARIKAGETTINRDAPEGQISAINISEYQKMVSYPLSPAAYALMESETPPVQNTPQQLPAPDMDPGSHLSYTWQWYAFGMLAFCGLFYSARSQARIMDEDPSVKEASPTKSGFTDEDYEDAILDKIEDAKEQN